MARVLDRVPLEEISARAATIDLRQVLLRLAAAPFMALGFLAAFLYAAVTWGCAAVLVGWDRGRQVIGASTGQAGDSSVARKQAGTRMEELRAAEERARAAWEQAIAERTSAEILATRTVRGG